ncbi:MAG: hypothetical protein ACRDTT_20165, partial [Pseudonocardiaceae bacterium]
MRKHPRKKDEWLNTSGSASRVRRSGGEAAAQIQSQLPGALSEVRAIASAAQTSVGQAVASGLGTLGKLEQATGKELAGQQAGTLGQISS